MSDLPDQLEAAVMKAHIRVHDVLLDAESAARESLSTNERRERRTFQTLWDQSVEALGPPRLSDQNGMYGIILEEAEADLRMTVLEMQRKEAEALLSAFVKRRKQLQLAGPLPKETEGRRLVQRQEQAERQNLVATMAARLDTAREKELQKMRRLRDRWHGTLPSDDVAALSAEDAAMRDSMAEEQRRHWTMLGQMASLELLQARGVSFHKEHRHVHFNVLCSEEEVARYSIMMDEVEQRRYVAGGLDTAQLEALQIIRQMERLSSLSPEEAQQIRQAYDQLPDATKKEFGKI
mmetsp:Transcript_46583/g.83328  ORF Transcript_46583/g.83328 Transcript_46583/m.83328 type:complete len:293 (-) Transcript_46583:586-1464(-)